jgi:hypothetical protein
MFTEKGNCKVMITVQSSRIALNSQFNHPYSSSEINVSNEKYSLALKSSSLKNILLSIPPEAGESL